MAVGRGGAAVAVRLCAVAVRAAVPLAMAWAVRMTCACAGGGGASRAASESAAEAVATSQARAAHLVETNWDGRGGTRETGTERGGGLGVQGSQRLSDASITVAAEANVHRRRF